MTLRARRIYYTIAILIFCITAPLVIALAAGWRWTGWRQGFVGTGTLVVTGSPRAIVEVNGKNVGPTPKRMSGLAPGSYQITLTRPGYSTWTHVVTVQQQTNTTVGPVQLFREPLKNTSLSPERFDGFVVSADQRALAGWTSSPAGGVVIRLLWPTISSETIELPAPPVWVALSWHQERFAIGLPNSTLIYSLPSLKKTWTLPGGEPVAWLGSSESIFFRLENHQLIAYDQLNATHQALQSAESMVGDESTIWLAQTAGSATRLQQRLNILAANTATVATLPGQWQAVGTIPRGVFVQAVDGRSALLVTINRLTNRLEERLIPGLTGVLPQQTSSRPLWVNGVDLLTFTENNQPVVLLRTPVPLISAEWVDPGDILATLDGSELIVRSVSAQQGRGTVVDFPWPAGGAPLLLDTIHRSAFMAVNGRVERISW